MAECHSDFKSIDSNLTDINLLCNVLRRYEYTVTRSYSPSETVELGTEELEELQNSGITIPGSYRSPNRQTYLRSIAASRRSRINEFNVGTTCDKSENRCPPCESDEWDIEELVKFDIDVNKIDRLYYFKEYLPCSSCLYSKAVDMYGRIDHKGQHLYFNMFVAVFESYPNVTIRRKRYLTFDAQMFLKSILEKECNSEEIVKLMIEDGLVVEEPSIFDLVCKPDWCRLGGVPTLSYLCHMTIYENQDLLHHYTTIMPNSVKKALEKFIKFRETRDDRDKRQYLQHLM